MAEFCSQLSMGRHNLAHRMNFFAVPRRVGRDFGGFLSIFASSLQIVPNLLAAGAGGIEILLCVALNFRCAAAAGSDFVPKLAQSIRQFRLVNGRSKLLRSKEALWLEGTGFTIISFGHIENDRVSVKLRGNVTIDRTG